MDDSPADLLDRWRAGDQQAATELFQRYAKRLVVLARSRLSSRLNRRIDSEDVVQSAYRSFFASAREGRFELEQGGDLWQLLVAITLHKLYDQVRKNHRDKRAVHREQHFDSDEGPDGFPDVPLIAHEPSPVEAVALVDQLEHTMRRLQPLQRRVLELRLQGYNLDEIAELTQRSQRTVRRLLEQLKERFRHWREEQAGT